jgi:hypothetical protein
MVVVSFRIQRLLDEGQEPISGEIGQKTEDSRDMSAEGGILKGQRLTFGRLNAREFHVVPGFSITPWKPGEAFFFEHQSNMTFRDGMPLSIKEGFDVRD